MLTKAGLAFVFSGSKDAGEAIHVAAGELFVPDRIGTNRLSHFFAK